jgi:hypothetical protein
VLEVGRPLEPFRQVPVPAAEQLHRRRQQHRADDRRVENDCDGEADAVLLQGHDLEREGAGEPDRV